MVDKPLHVLILVPDPVYPEPWAWAFHVEADALRLGGFEVSARPWTAPGDLNPFDAVMPLVVWGYHERYDEWLALLDRLESEGVLVINPPPLLRWNSDKAYLAEMDAKGIPTVHTVAVDALDEQALHDARDRFACERLVVKPPVSASATGTFLLWYPVIERSRVTALLDDLRATGIPRQFRIELGLRPDAPGRGMTAAGVVAINPPWTLPAAAAAGLPWLAAALGADGPVTAEWLTPEAP